MVTKTGFTRRIMLQQNRWYVPRGYMHAMKYSLFVSYYLYSFRNFSDFILSVLKCNRFSFQTNTLKPKGSVISLVDRIGVL